VWPGGIAVGCMLATALGRVGAVGYVVTSSRRPLRAPSAARGSTSASGTAPYAKSQVHLTKPHHAHALRALCLGAHSAYLGSYWGRVVAGGEPMCKLALWTECGDPPTEAGGPPHRHHRPSRHFACVARSTAARSLPDLADLADLSLPPALISAAVVRPPRASGGSQ